MIRLIVKKRLPTIVRLQLGVYLSRRKNGDQHLIMLDAKKGRWSFPELKEIALEENEYWEPDMMLIEAKASGQPLADELRLLNLPVTTFSPGRRKGGGVLIKL